MKNLFFLFTLLAFFSFSCNQGSGNQQELKEEENMENEMKLPAVSKAFFGDTPDGPADIYTLKNGNGVEVKITNFGGIITSIRTPDKDGNFDDIALGFDTLGQYLDGHPFFGAIAGRYANRIGNATFKLDGKTYNLAKNNGPNSLHGGNKGFDKVLWQASEWKDEQSAGVDLTYLSKDTEEGYPGNLEAKVRYALNNENELSIVYSATTDKPTVLNLTNHTYFNLAGSKKENILGHLLKINADAITPVDKTLIPTGKLMPVEETPFDFRKSTAIGARIDSEHEQIQFGGGYDHNFVLNRKGDGLEFAAGAYEPVTGRILEVFTTEPGVQFYSGNFLTGSESSRGRVYVYRSGFCLETQHFPDSPNKPEFPSVVLNPGETYSTTTVFKFLVNKSNQQVF